MTQPDTIFALSSGAPPAAIGIIRISGPTSVAALEALSGSLPPAREARLRAIRDNKGAKLDEGLVLWFPGPKSATGEDCAELHCHGGRAVVDAILARLGEIDGLREAEAGEFTRRAFANGVMDLAEAEGLADLLAAETELQRRAASAMVGGGFSAQVCGWREQLLGLSAFVEAALDFSDEDDVEALPPVFHVKLDELSVELREWLDRPHAERLREGYRVVLAGPPNSGKSTLFNALLDSEAAIVSPQAGTTRDVIERPVAMGGVPFTLVDIAGLRDDTDDEIEVIGIARAEEEIAKADCILWLGDEGIGPDGAWEIGAQIDREDASIKSNPRHVVSGLTGKGLGALTLDLINAAKTSLSGASEGALNERQRGLISEAESELQGARAARDPLIQAEHLRQARIAFDRLNGRASTEDMLDALFGRFCIGK